LNPILVITGLDRYLLDQMAGDDYVKLPQPLSLTTKTPAKESIPGRPLFGAHRVERVQVLYDVLLWVV
jgi:hypothetical protein